MIITIIIITTIMIILITTMSRQVNIVAIYSIIIIMNKQ